MTHITVSALFSLWTGRRPGTVLPVDIPGLRAACDPLEPSSALIWAGRQHIAIPTCPACAVLYDMALTQWAEEERRRKEDDCPRLGCTVDSSNCCARHGYPMTYLELGTKLHEKAVIEFDSK